MTRYNVEIEVCEAMAVVRWLYANLVEWIVGLLLLAIVTITAWQVFSRYVLNSPLSWSDEVAQLLLVWAAFLGAAVGVKRNAHLRIDFAAARLPAAARPYLAVLVNALILVVAASMTLYGWQFYFATSNDTSTSLGFSRNLFYVPIPISGMLMIVMLMPATLQSLRDRARKHARTGRDRA